MAHQSTDLQMVIGIIRRRKAPMLWVGFIIIALGTVLTMKLPPVYVSTATILVEEQEIPTDLVRSAITSYADQRIETIKHQVMSRSSLLNVIEKFDLYQGMRGRGASEAVVKRFVEDTDIEVINAKVVDKRSQTPTQATIAFTLAYYGENPQVTQAVTSELTRLFLAENRESRERRAQETTSFLRQEAERLSDHIEKLETKIAAIKQQASGALPELTSVNMQLMNQAERELGDVDRDIRSLEERKSYLEAELATIKPYTPTVSATGETILDASERLKALRAEYADQAAYLSAEHPDILRMKREIQALEKETGGRAPIDDVIKRLTGERALLASMLDRYGEDHPDVVRARKVVTSLEHQLRTLAQKPPRTAAIKPENPAYINIQAQLSSTTASLESLRAQRDKVKERAHEYARRLEQTPQFEPRYLDLTRDRDNAVQKYEELKSKLLEAQVSEGLEIQRKGERFVLIEPPDLPEKPVKPNRPVLLVLSLLLAVAGGAGSGVLIEHLDRTIRTPESLAQIAHALPLAIVPYIPTEADLRQAIARRRLLRLAGAGTIVLALFLGHRYWFPLDVLWSEAMRTFGIQ